MPTVRNPLVGGLLVASAASVTEGQLVLRDGATVGPVNSFPVTPGGGAFQPLVNFLVTVPATNLPRLCWWLFLDPTYTDNTIAGIFAAQVGITWQPIIDGFPATPPAILPVGVPVSYSLACACDSITVQILVPTLGGASPPGGLNSIRYNISAAQ